MRKGEKGIKGGKKRGEKGEERERETDRPNVLHPSLHSHQPPPGYIKGLAKAPQNTS